MADAPVSFPLSIRHAPPRAAAPRPAAWFIPGRFAGAWLDEIAAWGVPVAVMRLYVVPASPRDRQPCGVLVVGADGSASTAGGRALPYAIRAGRLYLPADAELFPPVTDEELRGKLRLPIQLIHPSAGLVGFAEEDALRVADLLAPPPRRPADWDRAVAGVSPPPRLISVEPLEPPESAEQFLDEGRDDIGSEAPQELPPFPGESTLSDALSKAARPGLKFLHWLTRQAPGSAASPTWVNKLQDYVGGKLGSLESALAAARFKELRRLREMLSADPDQGLRYAIPLSGIGQRGKAPPTARLGRRDVNFNAGRLGGGRPGDAWDVPWDLRQQLTAQYRAAADRELRLGRYRRAAYVFAELLGDFGSAADALKQGRHYRDAATLYRDKLKDRKAGAQCLEAGGLLTEALAEYEHLSMFEKAAELYLTLGRPDDATLSYRLAVEAARERGDTVKAAGLLETRLDAPDEALALLDAEWPKGTAAQTCLRAWFDLLGRLGRHGQAARRAARLGAADQSGEFRPLDAAQVMGAVASGYPDAAARAAAADAARVIGGRRLPASGPREAQVLLDVVRGLAPHDRLLGRDTARYLSRRPARPAAPPAPARPSKGVVVVNQFRLPGAVEWRNVVSAGSVFYALGYGEAGSVILRGRWDGVVQSRAWKRAPGVEEHLLLPGPGDNLGVYPLGARAEPAEVEFPRADAFPELLTAVTPASAKHLTFFGGCLDDSGTSWFLTFQDDWTLSGYRPDGTVVSTRSVDLDVGVTTSALMAARNQQVFIIARDRLVRVAPNGRMSEETLSGYALALAVSVPFTRLRLAVGYHDGGSVHWDDGGVARFGEGLIDPRITFIRGGALVAVSAGLARAYQTDDKSLKLHAAFAGPDTTPVEVVPVDKVGQFATFAPDGLVRVFQLTG